MGSAACGTPSAAAWAYAVGYGMFSAGFVTLIL